MESYKRLLLANRAWAQEKQKLKPGFFRALAEGQKPEFLWIGCSDSRVPAEDISGVEPGEIFVHRNIANLVGGNDANVLSVLQFAVHALKVKHIIVCGHHFCGGVRASLAGGTVGVLDQWLNPIREVADRNRAELEALEGDDKVNRLVELSVLAQVDRIAGLPLIQEAWAERGAPLVHGWVFNLRDGLLRALNCTGPK